MRSLLSAVAIMLVLSMPSPARAQHAHNGQKQAGMPSMTMDMAKMMQSPQHKLMMAYMTSMSTFATTLRNQALRSGAMDVEVARATVAELRYALGAMETRHEKHMQSMSADMQSKMQSMMERMDKDRTMLKDHVGVLEADVQADEPGPTQVAAHANALLKHLGMMSKMAGDGKARRKPAAPPK